LNSNRFPGVLWLMPIFFGIIGGVLAAMIASLKYEASWWELVVVGLIVTCIGVIAYVIFYVQLLHWFSSLWAF